jgi:putative FmdB family regulatory protein
MPTYEYACKSCGQHHEVYQSFKDDPLTECPACGGLLRKVFAPIGIAFKGSGFYKTDNRSSSKPSESKSSESTSSESKSSESKPAESKSSSSESKSSSSESKPAASA